MPGTAMAAINEMIAMTVRSSINVNPAPSAEGLADRRGTVNRPDFLPELFRGLDIRNDKIRFPPRHPVRWLAGGKRQLVIKDQAMKTLRRRYIMNALAAANNPTVPGSGMAWMLRLLMAKPER